MKKHDVKSWSKYFHDIVAMKRTHELRKNDRNYQIGDIMILSEYDPIMQHYVGNECEVEITSITSETNPCAVSKQALSEEYCILSIRRLWLSKEVAIQ